MEIHTTVGCRPEYTSSVVELKFTLASVDLWRTRCSRTSLIWAALDQRVPVT